jgi:hypothetical protein
MSLSYPPLPPIPPIFGQVSAGLTKEGPCEVGEAGGFRMKSYAKITVSTVAQAGTWPNEMEIFNLPWTSTVCAFGGIERD